uniref:Cuticle protein 8 n=1 Tax=Nilaparvata lugens TaxID=108931 RepID=A0A2Z4N523_NILLU|nr:cuticle protein 8 [Nilaparvata lugens]
MHSLQIVFGVAVMAVACAAVEYHAPVIAYHHAEPEHYAPAKYSFEYAVKDEHTGDIKSQHEVREGDSVKGYYTLVQPDGKKRIVEYTSEHKDGFNAIVHYEGEAKAYAPAPKYAPAPVYKYVAPAPSLQVCSSRSSLQVLRTCPRLQILCPQLLRPQTRRLHHHLFPHTPFLLQVLSQQISLTMHGI